MQARLGKRNKGGITRTELPAQLAERGRSPNTSLRCLWDPAPLRASAGASSAFLCCQSSFAALRLHKEGKAPYLYLILRLSFPFLCNCCMNVRGFRERGGEQKAQGSSALMEREGWRCPSGGQQLTEMHQRQQALT